MPSPILLSKLAHDAGFDVELGGESGFLAFAVPGRQLRAWIASLQDGMVVALSRHDIMLELNQGIPWNGPVPSAAVGAVLVSSDVGVIEVLIRARVLDQTLPQALLHEYQAAVAKIDQTEAYALAKQRRGQDLFRKGLMEYWQGCCAITGLDVPELLRASHAKPWKDATDAERLDVHNGLLLAAHLDAAFDRGLISIDVNGTVILSPMLSSHGAKVLGVDVPRSVCKLAPAHMPYLAWHQKNVLRQI